MDYILNLEVNEGVLLINKALEERDKRSIWDMWIARYPWMDKESFMPFSEFLDLMIGKNITTKSKEQILAEAEEIEKKTRMKRGDT
jgi:hypothetical protein